MKTLIISLMYPNPMNEIAGIFVEEQAKELIRQGCEIKVICPVPYSPFPFNKIKKRWKEYAKISSWEFRNGIKVYYPRYFQIPYSLIGNLMGHSLFHMQGQFLYWGIKEAIVRNIMDFKPEIIHAHAVFPIGYAVSLLKKDFEDIKTVLTIHGGDINIVPFRDRLVMNKVKSSLNNHNAIISVSQRLKEIAASISGRNQIRVIPNGVDINKFKLSDEDIKWITEKRSNFKGKKLLLFVGHIVREKGVGELLEAFTRISLHRNDIALLLVGEVIFRDYIGRYLNNLNGKVKIIGLVKHEEVKLWMNLCDIFVLPSYSEGLPVSMLEAMSCGKPVIVSDVGGVSEVVQDKQNGLLIKPKDVGSLVAGINFLLENPDKARSLGEEGRKTILENYTWAQNAKKTIEVYKDILES